MPASDKPRPIDTMDKAARRTVRSGLGNPDDSFRVIGESVIKQRFPKAHVVSRRELLAIGQDAEACVAAGWLEPMNKPKPAVKKTAAKSSAKSLTELRERKD